MERKKGKDKMKGKRGEERRGGSDGKAEDTAAYVRGRDGEI